MQVSHDIIEKLSEGDPNAFRHVFCTYFPKVRAFVVGFLKSDADADDVVQTIFIKLWTNREKLPEIENLDAYLYVMARNAVYNFISTPFNRYAHIDLSDISPASTETPQDTLVANDTQLMIDMVVSEMPAQRQKVYRMSREEGLSNDEIAARLGISKKTVENHIHLALSEIRKAVMLFYIMLTLWG